MNLSQPFDGRRIKEFVLSFFKMRFSTHIKRETKKESHIFFPVVEKNKDLYIALQLDSN